MTKNKILIILCFFTILNSTILQAFDLISKEEHIRFLGNKSNKPKKVIFRSFFGEKKNLPKIIVEQPII